jgi:Fe-S cluster biogenesis protein NfuA
MDALVSCCLSCFLRRNVRDERDFQTRIQRIGVLVQELDSIADPAVRAASKELVQLLMDLHGTGLERMLEIVFLAGERGEVMIDDLGRDSLVSSLLILYGLHPEDLSTRVTRAIEQVRPKLRKLGCEVELVSLQQGDVRLHASLEGHGCGSTAKTVHATLEEAVYTAAPDLTSFFVDGLDAPAASGFVALDKLLTATPEETVGLSSEGMD